MIAADHHLQGFGGFSGRSLLDGDSVTAPYQGPKYFSVVVFFICMRDAIEVRATFP